MRVGDTEAIVREGIAASIFTFDPPVFPVSSIVEKKVEECVRQALEQISGKAGVGNPPDCATRGEDVNEEAFVDSMSGVNMEAVAESGCFTFADALRRSNVFTETDMEVFIDASEMLTC